MKMPEAFGDALQYAIFSEITDAIVLERKLKHLAKLQKKYTDCQKELDALVAKVKARVPADPE